MHVYAPGKRREEIPSFFIYDWDSTCCFQQKKKDNHEMMNEGTYVFEDDYGMNDDRSPNAFGFPFDVGQSICPCM